MPTQSLLPTPKQRFYQSGGAVNAGGKVFTYAPGTNTKKATYSDSAGLVPNANPILLDARGEAIIYGTGSYKVVLALSTDTDPPTSPIWTQDGVTIISDVTVANSNAADSAAAAAASAASMAKSTNTASLISAIRTNGFFPQPVFRLAANDTPTITVGAAGVASTLNASPAASPNIVASDTRLKWLSGPTTYEAGSGTWSPRGAWQGTGRDTQYASIEFNHTGTAFEFSVVGSFYTATENLRVLVNDIAVTPVALPQADGAFHYVKFVFPVSALRRIRIESANGKYRGVNVVAGTEITSTGRTYPLISIMGDSFVEGTGAGTPVMDGEGVALVRALGCNIALGAVGSTGIINPGAGGKVAWTEATRIRDLTMQGVVDAAQGVSTAPALGIVCMSINDQGLAAALWSPFGTSFQAAINNRCWALIDAFRTANSGKPLLFYGPTWTQTTPQLDIYRIRDAAQEACAGLANVWFIDRLGPYPVLRSGANAFVSATGDTTNGNAAIINISSTTGMVGNAGIEGPGITAGARIRKSRVFSTSY